MPLINYEEDPDTPGHYYDFNEGRLKPIPTFHYQQAITNGHSESASTSSNRNMSSLMTNGEAEQPGSISGKRRISLNDYMKTKSGPPNGK